MFSPYPMNNLGYGRPGAIPGMGMYRTMTEQLNQLQTSPQATVSAPGPRPPMISEAAMMQAQQPFQVTAAQHSPVAAPPPQTLETQPQQPGQPAPGMMQPGVQPGAQQVRGPENQLQAIQQLLARGDPRMSMYAQSGLGLGQVRPAQQAPRAPAIAATPQIQGILSGRLR